MKECCKECLKCPDYPDSDGHNYCHNKECHCHTTELPNEAPRKAKARNFTFYSMPIDAVHELYKTVRYEWENPYNEEDNEEDCEPCHRGILSSTKLEYCDVCVQMTNYKGNTCMKHQPEKQQWGERFDKEFPQFLEYADCFDTKFESDPKNRKKVKSFISQLIKEEREAERERIREGIEAIRLVINTKDRTLFKSLQITHNEALDHALQIIDK